MQEASKMIVLILALCISFSGFTHPANGICASDSLTDSIHMSKSQKSNNLFRRIISYFDDTNKPKKKKRFDVSFIGGPHYSSDTRLGLGLMAAGNYYTKGDTTLMPSNVSLYSDLSTVGFYLIGISGNNIFSGEDILFDYNVNLYSFPTKFWGIGYSNGRNKNNETKYDLFSTKVSADLYFKLAEALYLGPGAQFSYMKGSNIDPQFLYLWNEERLRTLTTFIGFSAKYDTRDSFTDPHSGWLLSINQHFAPRFLGNKMAFSRTSFIASRYKAVWNGGIVATTLEGTYNYGNVPWTMLSTFGGSKAVRGYYEGRYRDKVEVEGIVELRQHVWRRNGIAIWGGAAAIAPSISKFRGKAILPCCGVGYRWEFKKRINVRLDFGIGRGEKSFVFNVNEAF